jgi:hypothetical protein
MRSALGKECRKLFRKLMAVEFPDYKEDKGQIVPQGWYVWTHKHSSGLYFHLSLVLHHSEDMFILEAGWSKTGQLEPTLGEKDKFLEKPTHIRLPDFWGYNGLEPWWVLVLRPEEHDRALLYKDDPIEDCLPLVAPAIWEAGEKVKEFVIPAFEEIARRHGGSAQKQF